MKKFKEFLLNLVGGFAVVCVLGILFCRGESFLPAPMSKEAVYYIRVPTPSAVTP